VFHDRIVDGNGQELASLAVEEFDQSVADDGRVVELVNSLAKASRNAILSRWLIVKAFNLAQSQDTAEVIYQAIVSARDGLNGSKVADYLLDLYPEGLPPQENWRQYLYRGGAKLRRLPGGAALLREIGLPVARSRRK
jgi:hypothetical protein